MRIAEFLGMLRGQEQEWFRKRFTEIMLHWWNNVLGFHRLDVDAGTIMKDAPAGVGQIIYAPDSGKINDQIRSNATVAPEMFIPGPLGEEVKFEDNFGRRVIAANHVVKPWDPSGGTDPQEFEGGDGTPNDDLPDEEYSEEELEHTLDQPEDTD
jgi:hypothetical protein